MVYFSPSNVYYRQKASAAHIQMIYRKYFLCQKRFNILLGFILLHFASTFLLSSTAAEKVNEISACILNIDYEPMCLRIDDNTNHHK